VPKPTKPLTYQECAKLYLDEERLDGENKHRCDTCGETKPAVRSCSIWRFAPGFVVQFKRFEEDSHRNLRKNCVVIGYPMQIRTEDYETDPNSPRPVYDLFGVILHSGTMSGGHCTCVVRDPAETSVWYEISDSHVQTVSATRARRPGAYELFYERQNI
jgi:ubiquitin C-terminal hydrolase